MATSRDSGIVRGLCLAKHLRVGATEDDCLGLHARVNRPIALATKRAQTVALHAYMKSDPTRRRVSANSECA